MPDSRDLKTSLTIDIARSIHRARRHLVSHAKAIAERSGLDEAQLSILNALGLGGPCKMGDLASKIVFDAPSLSRRAKALESAGLVVRQRSPESNREVIISLSRKGEAFFQKNFRELHDQHQAYLSRGLDAEQQKLLASLLQRLE